MLAISFLGWTGASRAARHSAYSPHPRSPQQLLTLATAPQCRPTSRSPASRASPCSACSPPPSARRWCASYGHNSALAPNDSHYLAQRAQAHFPTGPALDDKFWLYMITWHGGLFLTMLLGQIGVQGRKQNYW